MDTMNKMTDSKNIILSRLDDTCFDNDVQFNTTYLLIYNSDTNHLYEHFCTRNNHYDIEEIEIYNFYEFYIQFNTMNTINKKNKFKEKLSKMFCCCYLYDWGDMSDMNNCLNNYKHYLQYYFNLIEKYYNTTHKITDNLEYSYYYDNEQVSECIRLIMYYYTDKCINENMFLIQEEMIEDNSTTNKNQSFYL